MNWKNVEVPTRMKSLPRDRRGYPIPFVVLTDSSGEPNFRLDDAKKVHHCMINRLCGLCGQPLKDDMWVTGGAKRILSDIIPFIDAALHFSCGKYALQVCPFMASPVYNRTLTEKQIDKNKYPGLNFALQPLNLPRTPFFGFAKITSYDFEIHSTEYWHLFPQRPYQDLQFWKDGQQVSFEQVKDLL